MVVSCAEAECSHAVSRRHSERCVIIADLSKDWRFIRNPSRLRSDRKVCIEGDLAHA